METDYETRLSEFSNTNGDYEADDIAKLIIRAGDQLTALCLDDDAVDTAMKRLHQALDMPGFRSDHTGDSSWRTLWKETDTGNLERLPLAQRLTSLNAYAFFGLSPKADFTDCTVEDIKSVIEAVKAAVDSGSSDRPVTEEIDKTLLAAQGRLALDVGMPIAVDQMAALARIGVKSMRNAVAPSSGSGLEVADGAITAASAMQWLNARDNFKTSIWRNVITHESSPKAADPVKGEILWVPFASDKTEFHPSICRRAGKYTIGPKGSEEAIADYRKALDHLARMRPAPYWRRPNSAGNWSSVTAVGFHPRTAAELGLRTNKEEGE